MKFTPDETRSMFHRPGEVPNDALPSHGELSKRKYPDLNKERRENILTYNEVIISGTHEEKLQLMMDFEKDSSKIVICYGDMGDGTIKVLYGDVPKLNPNSGWGEKVDKKQAM